RIANVGGGTLEDYLLGVQMLNDKPIDIIELNISCPNVKAGGMEMVFEDALVASKALEIALTGKACGLEERAPMCGVPFHSANSYIS
ncbi:hypothetical protein ACTPEU_00035, partial [Clostridioides difficile]